MKANLKVIAKPKPPLDLYEQLRRDLEEIGRSVFKLGANSFTVQKFCEECNISKNQAYSRLRALQDAGKVKKLGRHGTGFYYERIVD